jgi:copper chaperone CopZ
MNQLLKSCGMLLMLCLFVGLSNDSQAQSKDHKNNTDTVSFTATSMDCPLDSKLVETALYRQKGVKKVKIDADTIVVVFNSNKNTADQLKTVIESTGSCEDPNDKIHKAEIKKD